MYIDTAYNVTHTVVFPESTLQLILDDDTAVYFLYRSAQWTEFVLHLYNRTITTTNRWDKFEYLNVRNHFVQLYKVHRNFLCGAVSQADRVTPVSAAPANGRLG